MVTLTGAPGLGEVKSTVGGVPSRATIRITAATAQMANRTTVTVTFHAKLTDPPEVPEPADSADVMVS
jgi:hypothetical protein